MGIKINDLRVFYGNVEAVNSFSLDIDNGEIVSLVGESGCGKTTILKAIAGLVPVSRGEIIFPDNFNLGMVFQNPALFPHLSIIKNVLLPLELQSNLKNKDKKAKASQVLELVGLKGLEERLPRELSGGQQQRVSLARAIVSDPNILLMDEPFGKLDALTRKRLNRLLLNLWEKLGQTIFFVTHDIEEAVFLSNRVIVLSGEMAAIKEIFEIDFPYPRDINTKRKSSFFELVEKIEKYF